MWGEVCSVFCAGALQTLRPGPHPSGAPSWPTDLAQALGRLEDFK